MCKEYGLAQRVKTPTRNEYLLDLVLTDVGAVKCEVAKKVADHALVIARFPLPVPEEEQVKRVVWDYCKADWHKLKRLLKEADWDFLDTSDPDEGAAELTCRLLRWMSDCIPVRTVTQRKSTHPWLTDAALD